MYVCMYVCMYICVHCQIVHTYIHTYIHTCVSGPWARRGYGKVFFCELAQTSDIQPQAASNCIRIFANCRLRRASFFISYRVPVSCFCLKIHDGSLLDRPGGRPIGAPPGRRVGHVLTRGLYGDGVCQRPHRGPAARRGPLRGARRRDRAARGGRGRSVVMDG